MDRAQYKSIAKAQLKNKWVSLIFVCVIYFLVLNSISLFEFTFEYNPAVISPDGMGIIFALFDYSSYGGAVFAYIFFAVVLSLLISPILYGVMSVGFSKYMIEFVKEGKTDWNSLFSGINNFKANYFLAFRYCLYIFLWSFVPIVGFIKTFSYALTFYIKAVNPELSSKECITLSRKFMNGHKWDMFVLMLSFIGWALLALLTLGIGLLWLNPYMEVTHANVYVDILKVNDFIPTNMTDDRDVVNDDINFNNQNDDVLK